MSEDSKSRSTSDGIIKEFNKGLLHLIVYGYETYRVKDGKVEFVEDEDYNRDQQIPNPDN